MTSVSSQRRLSDQLRLMLRRETRLSQVDVPELARRMGVSQSVLRRRLAAEGVSASQLVDEAPRSALELELLLAFDAAFCRCERHL